MKTKQSKERNSRNMAGQQRLGVIEFIQVCIGKFIKDNVLIMASGAVYTTLISLVPLITVLVSFLTLFDVITPFFTLLNEMFVSILGEQVGLELAGMIEKFALNASSLGTVGLVSFIFTSVLLINKLWTIVNQIYRTSPARGKVFKRMLTFLTILIVTALLLGAYISIKSLLSKRLALLFGWAFTNRGYINIFRVAGPWIIIWIFTFLIIKMAPNTKVATSSAALGALVGTIGIIIGNIIFNSLITFGFNYSVIYGSFAAVFFFLLWVYLMWIILLVSVEISYVHQYRPEKISLTHPVSPAEKLANGVNVMMVIGSNFRDGRGETRVKEIAEKLLMNDRELFGVIDMLVERKFIIPTNPGRTSYVPAKRLEDIRIVDLTSALYGEVYLEQNLDTIGDAVATQVNDKGIKTLGSLTIANLLERI